MSWKESEKEKKEDEENDMMTIKICLIYTVERNFRFTLCSSDSLRRNRR